MVAMFKYSPVLTYSVSLPSQKMQFNYSGGGEFLKKDSENVCTSQTLLQFYLPW